MKESATKIKYFIYARKSSESDDRQIQSIDDQINRLKQLAKDSGLSVKKIYTESKSAKKPNNRPVFSEMIERIQNGEADGILTWQMNRLSRNPVDSGTIQWLLQNNILKSIQTIDREYKPEDNALLFSVESGMANQFILELRKNTLRGMYSKLNKGWQPNLARLGYLNDKLEKTIIKDPDRFHLVKKMWELMLTGNYSVSQILKIVNNDWKFTTRKGKRRGGKPLSLSGLYKVFTTKFYAGVIEWNGGEYPGLHEPMITLEEFERVQLMIGRKDNPRPQKHLHAYSGLIVCGECGARVTVETKYKHIKSTGEKRHYIYYHCTHKKKYIQCSQSRVISEQDLEKQIELELAKYTILPEFRDWALEILNEKNDEEIMDRFKIHEMQTKTLLETQKQLDSLTQMRYRELIDDQEYLQQKNLLTSQIISLRNKIKETESRTDNWLELCERTFDFAAYAWTKFTSDPSLATKREIFTALGQNFTLKDGKLNIQANPWFIPIAEGYPAIEKEYLRSEPNKNPVNTGIVGRNMVKPYFWGA